MTEPAMCGGGAAFFVNLSLVILLDYTEQKDI